MAKTKVAKPEIQELDRKSKIDAAIKGLEKDYGKGTVLGANEKPKYHDCISTGSLGLDKALGVGGLPKGRVVEIFGPESSGKTTMCLELISEAHKDKESYCAFVDTEHALDTSYAEKLGVDLDRLKVSQPDYGEQALEVVARLVETNEFAVIIVDSIAALTPKAELEGDMGDASMGRHARLMSQAMRKLTAITSKSGTILVFTNQLRDKIGVMFGSPETTTGGNAMKFYASVRLDVRRYLSKDDSVMENDIKIGNMTKVKVIKNKVSPPFRDAKFDILYGEGIDEYGEVIDMAVECSVLDKSGAWYSYKDKNIAQGRESLRKLFKEDGKLYQEIRELVKESFVPTVSEEEE